MTARLAWLALCGLFCLNLSAWAEEPADDDIFSAVGRVFFGPAEPAVPAKKGPAPAATPDDSTHRQVKAVKVESKSGGKLQTLTVTPSGKVVCLTGASSYAPVGANGEKEPTSEVFIFSANGEAEGSWKVPFAGQAVAAGPSGEIYVAGNGRIGKFSLKGEVLASAEIAPIADTLRDNAGLKKQAEAQLEANRNQFGEQIKELKEQIAALEKKAADAKPTKSDEQQLRASKAELEAYQRFSDSFSKQTVETIIEQLTSRVRRVNGLSVTEKDVYVMCGETKGYGFALWRLDLKFGSPAKVLSQLSGCCGQMDVQVEGDKLYVAENTRHRVAIFDRDGKAAGGFGARGRESKGLTFGGCCNPMNCRVTSTGEVYTAESEGIIKKFDAKGQFVAHVCTVKLTGGCKNVAVAASQQGDKVYFCDLPGSQFLVLEQSAKPDVKAAAKN